MNLTEAAKRLGVPVDEVKEVADSPAGTLITTFDGVRYVDVPEDHPDDDGAYGIMLLSAPTPAYGGAFPVYAQPGTTPIVAEPDHDPDMLERLKAEVIESLSTAPGVVSAAQVKAIEDRLERIEGEKVVDSADDADLGIPPAGSSSASARTAAEQEAVTHSPEAQRAARSSKKG